MSTKIPTTPLLSMAKVRTPTMTMETKGGTLRDFMANCIAHYKTPEERLAVIADIQKRHEEITEWQANEAAADASAAQA